MTDKVSPLVGLCQARIVVYFEYTSETQTETRHERNEQHQPPTEGVDTARNYDIIRE